MFLVIFRWKYYYWPIMGGWSIPNQPRGLRRHWGCSGISVGTSGVAGATHGARLPTIRTTNIILKNYKINENQRKSMKTRLVPRGRWRWCWLAFLSLESKVYLFSIFSFWYDLLVAFSQSSQTPCTVKSRFRVCTPPSIAVAAGGSAPLHPPCVAFKEGCWVVRVNVRFLESLEGAPIRANAYGGLYSSLERATITIASELTETRMWPMSG